MPVIDLTIILGNILRYFAIPICSQGLGVFRMSVYTLTVTDLKDETLSILGFKR